MEDLIIFQLSSQNKEEPRSLNIKYISVSGNRNNLQLMNEETINCSKGTIKYVIIDGDNKVKLNETVDMDNPSVLENDKYLLWVGKPWITQRYNKKVPQSQFKFFYRCENNQLFLLIARGIDNKKLVSRIDIDFEQTQIDEVMNSQIVLKKTDVFMNGFLDQSNKKKEIKNIDTNKEMCKIDHEKLTHSFYFELRYQDFNGVYLMQFEGQIKLQDLQSILLSFIMFDFKDTSIECIVQQDSENLKINFLIDKQMDQSLKDFQIVPYQFQVKYSDNQIFSSVKGLDFETNCEKHIENLNHPIVLNTGVKQKADSVIYKNIYTTNSFNSSLIIHYYKAKVFDKDQYGCLITNNKGEIQVNLMHQKYIQKIQQREAKKLVNGMKKSILANPLSTTIQAEELSKLQDPLQETQDQPLEKIQEEIEDQNNEIQHENEESEEEQKDTIQEERKSIIEYLETDRKSITEQDLLHDEELKKLNQNQTELSFNLEINENIAKVQFENTSFECRIDGDSETINQGKLKLFNLITSQYFDFIIQSKEEKTYVYTHINKSNLEVTLKGMQEFKCLIEKKGENLLILFDNENQKTDYAVLNPENYELQFRSIQKIHFECQEQKFINRKDIYLTFQLNKSYTQSKTVINKKVVFIFNFVNEIYYLFEFGERMSDDMTCFIDYIPEKRINEAEVRIVYNFKATVTMLTLIIKEEDQFIQYTTKMPSSKEVTRQEIPLDISEKTQGQNIYFVENFSEQQSFFQYNKKQDYYLLGFDLIFDEEEAKNNKLRAFKYFIGNNTLIFLAVGSFNSNTQIFLEIFEEIKNKINIQIQDAKTNKTIYKQEIKYYQTPFFKNFFSSYKYENTFVSQGYMKYNKKKELETYTYHTEEFSFNFINNIFARLIVVDFPEQYKLDFNVNTIYYDFQQNKLAFFPYLYDKTKILI